MILEQRREKVCIVGKGVSPPLSGKLEDTTMDTSMSGWAGEENISPGLKPIFRLTRNTQAEALAYLEATAKTDAGSSTSSDAGSFDMLRTGSSIWFGAKNAPNSAQDDTPFLLLRS
jgi:hypothetical protein